MPPVSPATVGATWHPDRMPAWLREAIDDSSVFGVALFAAIPVVVVVLVVVGIVPGAHTFPLLGGWSGALLGVWFNRKRRRP